VGMKILNNSRGIALLLSISITSVVVAVSLDLHRKVRSAVITTASMRDRLVMTQMASGGIHAAMAMLVRDRMTTAIDSFQEDWANPEKIDALLMEIPFEEGKVTVTIEDELGRIQVNALVEPPNGQNFSERQRLVWERYLDRLIPRHEAFEQIDPTVIVSCLKDWMDSGDDEAITGLNGAESDHYEGLEPPYGCRNGPLKHPAEMVRIKGILPALYNGVEDIAGLSRHVTVYGMHPLSTPSNLVWEGKININTAPLPVLAALLPPEVQELAEAIDEFRKENDNGTYLNDLSSATWYKMVPGLSELQIPSEVITLSSDFFRIIATASLHELKMRMTVVVQREQQKKTGKWMCRVLSWQAE